MHKERDEPQHDNGGFLKKGEYIINRGAVERVFTQEQWDKIRKMMDNK